MIATKYFISFLILSVLLLYSGCASNPVAEYYRNDVSGLSKSDVQKMFALPSRSSVIVGSNDLGSDYKEAIRKGFLVVGQSSFSIGGGITADQIKKHASSVHADLVLVKQSSLGTQRVNYNAPVYNPGAQTTTHTSGTFDVYSQTGRPLTKGKFQGTSNTNTLGTISFVPMSVDVERVEYDILFLRKSSGSILGIQTTVLDSTLRTKLGRNTGLLVDIVVHDSPAFYANIMEGDIIVRFNGVEVTSPQNFSEVLIVENAGKRVVLDLIRGDREAQVEVQLNPLKGGAK